jgi:hypothetical protein
LVQAEKEKALVDIEKALVDIEELFVDIEDALLQDALQSLPTP